MKFKKILYMVICFSAFALLAGCDKNTGANKHSTSKQTGVEDVLQAGIAEANNSGTNNVVQNLALSQSNDNEDALAPTEEENNTSVPKNLEGIDVDLTALSSTMVYSEVFNMMVMPEEYIGKTIKMNGLFTTYHEESTDTYYFACIIEDATACCAQGIEFVLKEDYSYPDDYPKEGEEITVIGVFDTYKEGDSMYCTLRNAKLV